jgi:hypothetical protein
MDHIPLPQNATRPHIEVPCLYNPEYAYDHLDWNTFAERKGFHMGQLLLGKMKTKGFRDVLSFIQTWFFFGVIEVIASEFGLKTNPTDFMIWNEGQCLISTRKLPDLIHAMLSQETGQEDSRSLKAVATQYLRIARGFIRQVHDVEAENYVQLYFNHPDLTEPERRLCQTVTLSIACLGEAFTQECDSSLAVKDRPWARSIFLHHLFKESGWCPRQISLAEQKTSSLTALYFLSAVDRRSLASLHRTCTDRFCDLEHLEETPKLHTPDCSRNDCVDVIVENEKSLSISPIVGASNIPLVTYQRHDLGVYCVSVSSFDPLAERVVPYVAFSHVWSE